MNRENVEKLLDRYLNGNTSAQENDLIEQWLQEQHNTNSRWEQMDAQEKEQWLSGKFKEISNEIQATRAPVTRRLNWRIVTAAAAAIVLAFTLYVQWPAISTTWNAEQLTVQTTNASQKKLVILPDGSRVWLNNNSKLSYPGQFNGAIREVVLSGEAYFDVAHDEKRTFIIRTGSFTTTVLGTAFNIKEDKTRHTVQVTVNRGKVRVANAGKTLAFLTRNQQISFNLPTQQAVKTSINAQQVITWRQNDLHFDDVNFGEAIAQLSMHFGVKISFSNEDLKHCRFTGTNLADQELEEILKTMCAFNNATYSKGNDGSIIISGEGCN